MTTITLKLPYTGDVSNNRYCRHSPKGGVYVLESAKLWGLFVKSGLNSLLPKDFSGEWLEDERPFEMGQNESAWAKNRRAHLVLARR